MHGPGPGRAGALSHKKPSFRFSASVRTVDVERWAGLWMRQRGDGFTRAEAGSRPGDPGAERSTEIHRRLDAAGEPLVVSADFLALSDRWESEMTRACERHEAREARIVPVIVRPCDWKSTPLAKLQPAPKDAIPVTGWADPKDAWVDVAQRIRKLVTEEEG